MYRQLIFLALSSFVLISAHWSDTHYEPMMKDHMAYSDTSKLIYQTGSRYVDDEQCGMCHGELYDSFQEVGMAKSFYRPGEQAYIENFENNTYYHQESQRYFEMSLSEELYFRRYQIDSKGDTINDYRRKVDWVMGSGHKSRTYIYQTNNGELYLLPIAWYGDIDKWRMAPGFQSRNGVILNRQVLRECMFCHNAYPDDIPQAAQYHWEPDVFSHSLPSGIGCQRCHGPGGDHIDNVIMTNNDIDKINGSIINPAKLPNDLRDDVCNQCHLQPTIALMGMRRFDHGDYSFRPGQRLSSYIVHFDVDEEDMNREDRFEINHHAYRLYQSECYTQSLGKLGCISCHDPHVKLKEADKVEHFKQVCTSCHDTHERHLSTGRFAQIAMDDCTSCHMPQHRTQDVIHTYTTDHKISLPTEIDLLEERQEKNHAIIKLDLLEMDSLPQGPLGQAYIAAAAVRSYGGSNTVNHLAKTLVAADVQEITPYYYLAKGQMGIGAYESAEQTLDKILKVQPESSLALLWKSICLMRERRITEALDLLNDVTRLDPSNANAFYNLGIGHEALREYEEAEVAFRKVIELRMEFAAAHLHLANCLTRTDRVEGAKDALLQAVRIDPAYDKAYAQIGSLYIESDQKDEAVAYWRRGLQYGLNGDVIRKAAANYNIEL